MILRLSLLLYGDPFENPNHENQCGVELELCRAVYPKSVVNHQYSVCLIRCRNAESGVLSHISISNHRTHLVKT